MLGGFSSLALCFHGCFRRQACGPLFVGVCWEAIWDKAVWPSRQAPRSMAQLMAGVEVTTAPKLDTLFFSLDTDAPFVKLRVLAADGRLLNVKLCAQKALR